MELRVGLQKKTLHCNNTALLRDFAAWREQFRSGPFRFRQCTLDTKTVKFIFIVYRNDACFFPRYNKYFTVRKFSFFFVIFKHLQFVDLNSASLRNQNEYDILLNIRSRLLNVNSFIKNRRNFLQAYSLSLLQTNSEGKLFFRDIRLMSM